MTEIYVVMSNDYPSAVFSDEESADSFCAAKNAEDKQEFPHRRVFWRAYSFDLDKEASQA